MNTKQTEKKKKDFFFVRFQVMETADYKWLPSHLNGAQIPIS